MVLAELESLHIIEHIRPSLEPCPDPGSFGLGDRSVSNRGGEFLVYQLFFDFLASLQESVFQSRWVDTQNLGCSVPGLLTVRSITASLGATSRSFNAASKILGCGFM